MNNSLECNSCDLKRYSRARFGVIVNKYVAVASFGAGFDSLLRV